MSTNFLRKHESGSMRDLYAKHGLLASSPNADDALIRSHIAHCVDDEAAARAVIKPSRGRRYHVETPWFDPCVVRVVDEHDHRNGVEGWRE